MSTLKETAANPVRRHSMLFAGVLVVIAGAFAVYAAARARGPDLDLSSTREVRSGLPASVLGAALKYPVNWPKFIAGVTEASVVNGIGQPYGQKDQWVVPGALVLLELGLELGLELRPEGARGHPATFPLTFEVREWTPDKNLTLELVSDPTLKIRPFLSKLTLRIALTPLAGGGTRVQANIEGRTAHWKTRALGSFLPRRVLKRFVEIDLESLARLERPLAPDGSPVIFN